jgi:hypothetical protein
MKNNKINSIEKYFFLLITGLNLIPILSGKFFPTLDGPAHLYNSQLINSLLFEGNKLLSDFFSFTHEPVPNWTGHIILSFFNLFLPAFVAEKVLLLFYMIGLPLSFRALLKTIYPSNNLFSYLIFPFTYSFVFFLGFYNFSIALVFMLITLNYWIKHEDNLSSIKNMVILSLLTTLTYFSHIFVFGILIIIIGLYILMKGTIKIFDDSTLKKEILVYSFRKLRILLISSFIPLVLFVYYFYLRSNSGNNIFLSHSELIDWLKNIRPIIALNSLVEEVYTKKIFYIISSICIIALYNRINEIHLNTKFSFKNVIRISDVWLFASIAILFLYFKLPDSDGSAGYVTVRLGLLFFIFLIIWLSTQNLKKWYSLLVVAAVLYCHFKLNVYYTSATKGLNKVAIECNNASNHILPNSIVLPLNYSDNWLYGHFSNYLGIDKPMIILENYECGTGYFPLKWNENSMPNTLFGDMSIDNQSCSQWKSNTQNSPIKIDYVFVLGNIDLKTDSCNQKIKQTLLDNYTLIYHSENCNLYQFKNK